MNNTVVSLDGNKEVGMEQSFPDSWSENLIWSTSFFKTGVSVTYPQIRVGM